MPKTVIMPAVGDFATKQAPDGEWIVHAEVIASYTNGNVWVEWMGTKEREVIQFSRLEWNDENETWRYHG